MVYHSSVATALLNNVPEGTTSTTQQQHNNNTTTTQRRQRRTKLTMSSQLLSECNATTSALMALVTTVSMLLAMLWYFYSNDECTARTAITIRPVVLKPKLLCGHALKMLKHQGAVASVLERSGDSYETTEHLELVLDDARDIAERLGIDHLHGSPTLFDAETVVELDCSQIRQQGYRRSNVSHPETVGLCRILQRLSL